MGETCVPCAYVREVKTEMREVEGEDEGVKNKNLGGGGGDFPRCSDKERRGGVQHTCHTLQ